LRSLASPLSRVALARLVATMSLAQLAMIRASSRQDAHGSPPSGSLRASRKEAVRARDHP